MAQMNARMVRIYWKCVFVCISSYAVLCCDVFIVTWKKLRLSLSLSFIERFVARALKYSSSIEPKASVFYSIHRHSCPAHRFSIQRENEMSNKLFFHSFRLISSKFREKNFHSICWNFLQNSETESFWNQVELLNTIQWNWIFTWLTRSQIYHRLLILCDLFFSFQFAFFLISQTH